MYHFVLAPDSFKESLKATEACKAMEEGIKQVFHDATVTHKPMADGGEGTVEAITNACKGTLIKTQVTDALGRTFGARYGLIHDNCTAVVELAAASGIASLEMHQRNPMYTSTFGTGLLIRHALQYPIRKIIIGLGGSATNDGGTGLATALGLRFLDKDGLEIPQGGGFLHKLHHIDDSENMLRKRHIEIEIAADVENPLCGSLGASHVYGPQKGATPQEVKILDQNLEHLARVVKKTYQTDFANLAGAGAAGGTAFGLMSFFGAKMYKGFDLVVTHTHLEEAIKKADIVFTGEGSIDQQTQYGKTAYGVAQLAKKYQVPVIAFAGRVSDKEIINACGFDAAFSILHEVSDLSTALTRGYTNLQQTVANVCNVLKASK